MGATADFMLLLDLPTAALLAGVGGLAIAVLVLLVARTLSPSLVPGLRMLALGMAAYGAGFLIVAFKQQLPPWVSPVLGNGALVFSTVAMAAVLRRLHRLPVRATAWWGVALALVCMAQNDWFVFHSDTVNLRLAIGTTCHLVVATTLLVVPWQVPRRRRSLGLWLVFAAFAFFAAFLLQRITLFAFAGPMRSVFDLPSLQSLSYLSAVMLPLVAGFGFLQICSQWTQHEVKRIADADYLTGCLNRHAFEEQAVERIDETRRNRRPLALVMLDIDGLKRFNLAHGRASGDRTLNRLATLLRDLLGDEDLLARTGGDEFAVLLDGAGLSAAQAFGDRLRARLADADAAGGERLSVAIGLAAYVRGRDDFQSMLQRAEAAMYAQKQAHAD